MGRRAGGMVFSIVDVVGVLTDSPDYKTGRKYWNKLKQRLKEEGSELVTNCHQLKMRAADGKGCISREAAAKRSARFTMNSARSRTPNTSPNLIGRRKNISRVNDYDRNI